MHSKLLNKTKELKNKHGGENCFIILNGPSLKVIDVTKIKNAKVICVNYFVETFSNPDYAVCWDRGFFDPLRLQLMQRNYDETRSTKFINNLRSFNVLTKEQSDRTYYVYGKHFPSATSVRSNLAGLSSSFVNSHLFAILSAIYMGFSRIYLVGLDMNLENLYQHNYENVQDKGREDRVLRSSDKDIICTAFRCYTLCQYQSFYMSAYAKIKGVKIYNTNLNSSIRAYSFKPFDDAIDETSQVSCSSSL